ncbi:FT-interacting protein 3-like [Juglans regia]|uniref:FT-interacting protein 3-like n=2 Tax=Juglans regia TaxID=51240 RepID=A0A2I4HSG3_JUGRE|nr:FT-interacting protein 3-like [Juglans regia]
MQRSPPEGFLFKEPNPHLGGEKVTGDKHKSAYDLVHQMPYLYVRVVKAKDLPEKDIGGSCDPYVEVSLRNRKGSTRDLKKESNCKWNQIFAFSGEQIQSSELQVTVKDKNFPEALDAFIGRVLFNVIEVPRRVPPDSPVAPEWYEMVGKKGEKAKGKLKLALWMGTQADEEFREGWKSDSAGFGGSYCLASMPSKVYLHPKLWYLSVNVIEAQNLRLSDEGWFPRFFVRAILGNQQMITSVSQSRTINPKWNEDLMFVAEEQFEEYLILSVENRVAFKNDEVVGTCRIPLQRVDRRLDNKPVNPEWYNLQKNVVAGEEQKETKFSSRIHMRICLEGGYHVLDESTHHISDLRPTVKQLWKSSIGVLELGILNAQGLMPMKTKDGRGTTDAYCVAKYGHKWVRTRTIIDSLRPKWNEQYAWEVFDPCTVVTIGVFDNCHLHGGDGKYGRARDSRIGKVRIRLSTLETDRVYTHSYPLLVLHPNGVKKMGEIHLAVRFTCSSLLNMMHMYSHPILPKMHYLHPLTVSQLDKLRHHATQIVSMRLSRAEPPLRKEVVEYMLDVDGNIWSLRKSKANFIRLMAVLGGLMALPEWFDQICNWKNPITTLLIHVLFIALIRYPEHILPIIFLYLFLVVVLRYRRRPRCPPHLDTRLSQVDTTHPDELDELDEEFDTYPSSRPSDIVSMRYDRLRSIAGRIQTKVGDLAVQAERLQTLLSWRDPRATALFVIFCPVGAIVLFVIPFQVVALLAGFFKLRHPRFRQKLPSVLVNFFRRLPAQTDCML